MTCLRSATRSAWVIDPVSKQVWHRDLEDPLSGLVDRLSIIAEQATTGEGCAGIEEEEGTYQG